MAFEQKLDKDEGANHEDIFRKKIPTLSGMFKDSKKTHS